MSTASSIEKLNTFNYSCALYSQQGNNSFVFDASLSNISRVTMLSRNFNSYDECVMSGRALMEDVAKKMNASSKSTKLKVASEINPVYTGISTLSKDWAEGEVCRLWIYDKAMEKTGQIYAVGQLRVYGAKISTAHQLN